MRRSRFGWVAILSIAAVSFGCDDADPAPDPTPVPVIITERFSGSLTVNGAITFPFSATSAGQVLLTVTAIAPDATIPLGVSLGTWDGFAACQVILDNNNALVGSQVRGQASAAGNLCARVYDVGKFSAPITFEITVTHN